MEYKGWRWSLDGRGCAKGGTVVEEKAAIKRRATTIKKGREAGFEERREVRAGQ